MPALEYFFERVNVESGDRFSLVEFFRGARVFDPAYAASHTLQECLELIDKLKHYPILTCGEDSIIDRMKRGLRAYRQNARQVKTPSDFSKSKNAILTWNYRLFLRLDDENKADHLRKECRYCGKRNRSCRCNKNLRAWWEAAELVALVMPLSGAAERVFSLASNLLSDKQSSMLADALYLTLFLNYNKRRAML